MAFNDNFRRIANFKFECLNCGEHVDAGIANIAGHWAECGGKQFVLSARTLIDTMSLLDQKNRELIQTVGILLQMRKSKYKTDTGIDFEGVEWSEIEDILKEFGYKPQ